MRLRLRKKNKQQSRARGVYNDSRHHPGYGTVLYRTLFLLPPPIHTDMSGELSTQDLFGRANSCRFNFNSL